MCQIDFYAFLTFEHKKEQGFCRMPVISRHSRARHGLKKRGVFCNGHNDLYATT